MIKTFPVCRKLVFKHTRAHTHTHTHTYSSLNAHLLMNHISPLRFHFFLPLTKQLQRASCVRSFQLGLGGVGRAGLLTIPRTPAAQQWHPLLMRRAWEPQLSRWGVYSPSSGKFQGRVSIKKKLTLPLKEAWLGVHLKPSRPDISASNILVSVKLCVFVKCFRCFTLLYKYFESCSQ